MFRNSLPETTGPALYTIGCSNGDITGLFEELSRFGITALVDIRSVPYSAYTPQFNKEALIDSCKLKRIAYVHMGTEFGAMRTAPEPFRDGTISTPITDGTVDFKKVRETEAFRRGVERIDTALKKGFRIALMCTELNPEDCHRSILVAPEFVGRTAVGHILRNGFVLTHGELEKRLLSIGGPYQDSLFGETALEQAYSNRNKKIGIKISHKEQKRKPGYDFGRF